MLGSNPALETCTGLASHNYVGYKSVPIATLIMRDLRELAHSRGLASISDFFSMQGPILRTLTHKLLSGIVVAVTARTEIHAKTSVSPLWS